MLYRFIFSSLYNSRESPQQQGRMGTRRDKTSDTFHVVSSCYKEKIRLLKRLVLMNLLAKVQSSFIVQLQDITCSMFYQGWDVMKVDEALHTVDKEYKKVGYV